MGEEKSKEGIRIMSEDRKLPEGQRIVCTSDEANALINEIGSHLLEATQDNTELSLKIEGLKRDNERLEKTNEEAIVELEDLENELGNSRSEYSYAMSMLEKARAEMVRLEVDNVDLRNKIERLKYEERLRENAMKMFGKGGE